MASITVTLQPSLACACAISMPIGPPPMMARWAGFSASAKIVSLVWNGTVSRPGTGGTAAREPVAMTKNLARTSCEADRTSRRPAKAARSSIT